MFSTIFHEILYRPLLNALVFLYETVSFHDLGVAIIVLTLLIRFLLYPVSHKALVSQKQIMAIQPDLKKIQEKHKENREEQMKHTMALYKERGVNPLGGCLPLLVQLPIIIALYWVFLAGFEPESLKELYSFVPNPGEINYLFLGFLDISKQSIILSLVAGALQFFQSKHILEEQKKHTTAEDFKKNPSLALSRQMTYMMPVVTVLIAYSLHAGIALYWATTTAFSLVQQRRAFKRAGEPRA